jgi:hypothetical protein
MGSKLILNSLGSSSCPTTKRNSWGVPLFEILGLRIKRNLEVVSNRDGEKTNALPRGSLRPMDQPPGHRMGAGVTRVLSI